LDSQKLLQEQQRKLQELTSIFFQESRGLSQIKGNPNFPVFVYSPDSWAENLQEQGYITSSFSYPTPSSPRVNRVVLSASHSKEEVHALSQFLTYLAGSL